MGKIDAPLGAIQSVGAGIEAVAPELGTVARTAAGLSGAVSDPPATAAALDAMATRWSAATARFEDEIAGLGVAVQATAVAYQTADESSMNAGGGTPGEGDGPAGGGGGSGSW
ncbi:MAG: hypothetical protein ACRDL4_20985 [Thermoleophilaceae bacterium]